MFQVLRSLRWCLSGESSRDRTLVLTLSVKCQVYQNLLVIPFFIRLITVSLNFQRGVHDAEIKHGFYAKTQTCIETTDIEGLLEDIELKVLEAFESFENRGKLT